MGRAGWTGWTGLTEWAEWTEWTEWKSSKSVAVGNPREVFQVHFRHPATPRKTLPGLKTHFVATRFENTFSTQRQDLAPGIRGRPGPVQGCPEGVPTHVQSKILIFIAAPQGDLLAQVLP